MSIAQSIAGRKAVKNPGAIKKPADASIRRHGNVSCGESDDWLKFDPQFEKRAAEIDVHLNVIFIDVHHVGSITDSGKHRTCKRVS
jgi:hypothetical protein